MHTTYEFTKDGKTYSATGNNRFDAQRLIETALRIDLIGAEFTELYKLKEVRKGIV